MAYRKRSGSRSRSGSRVRTARKSSRRVYGGRGRSSGRGRAVRQTVRIELVQPGQSLARPELQGLIPSAAPKPRRF